MKKLFTILTTVLFCGALMVSCNKENKEDNTKLPTKADLVGTWEGSYSGTATLEEKQSVNYTIVWTLTMNPENSATFGSLSYKLNITGYEELTHCRYHRLRRSPEYRPWLCQYRCRWPSGRYS